MSLVCLLRGLPLVFSARPRTPLRVLCVVALDTVHALRRGRPLPRERCRQLAAFLDFQACANAVWDGKELCAPEYRALRQQLESVGLGAWMAQYLDRLRKLETRRPSIGGEVERFDAVRSYREAVARLSLGTLVAMALNAEGPDEGIQATSRDPDLAALFQMAMQCQIMDDVIDYRKDLRAALPSFLTSTASRPQAVAFTSEAARIYARREGHAPDGVFPLDAALRVLTLATKCLVGVARLRAVRT